ncbi:hypothetical protein HNV08_10155 [Winogradskyella eckloniae]|uniref:hypothetical protein n=1 Tax=Winogradskyella eckloniae TaxID=1089306 RepID=UPI001565BC78|nr:hypothetical protein [Winogradskyella eckloniae]NRD20408.1 hypothetical protein [Winogradskyella eckloniae]
MYFFTLLFFGFCFLLSTNNQPKVGDELIIKKPTTQYYKHIYFPKPNILIKRGTVTGYKSVENKLVVVKEVISKENGDYHVVLTQQNNSKFFGFQSHVKSELHKGYRSRRARNF